MGPSALRSLTAGEASARPLRRREALTALVAATILVSARASARAQDRACELVPDGRNPQERILHCGDGIVVRPADGADYHLVDQPGHPDSLLLDRGAVMVEFHRSEAHPSFQIQAPYAIAAVRGTKWIVDAAPTMTSTFVIEGVVAVFRPGGAETALLHPGEGADVSPDSGPIVVKRWPAARVRRLLARFGL
jgi:hypothetical protein